MREVIFLQVSPQTVLAPLHSTPCRTLADQSAACHRAQHTVGPPAAPAQEWLCSLLSAQAVWGLLQACLTLGAGGLASADCIYEGSIRFTHTRTRTKKVGRCFISFALSMSLAKGLAHCGCLIRVNGKNKVIENNHGCRQVIGVGGRGCC